MTLLDRPQIDTQVAGVKLRAVWDPGTQVLRLVVTARAFFAPCDVIWGRIDSALQGILPTQVVSTSPTSP